MVRRGITFDELAKRLAAIGVALSARSATDDNKPRQVPRRFINSVLDCDEMSFASHH
jgi:hypothetical protein